MYMRFVTPGRGPARDIAPGFFRSDLTWDICDDAPVYLRKAINTELDWFNTNLPFPGRTWVRSKGVRQYHGICWFDCQHAQTVSRAWGLAALFREAGLLVRVLRTDQPGQILYRDAQQVVAKPTELTPCRYH